jgi:hypothetical protein
VASKPPATAFVTILRELFRVPCSTNNTTSDDDGLWNEGLRGKTLHSNSDDEMGKDAKAFEYSGTECDSDPPTSSIGWIVYKHKL